MELDLDTMKYIAKIRDRIFNTGGKGILYFYEGFGMARLYVLHQILDVLIARAEGRPDPKVFSNDLIEEILGGV